MGRYIIKLDTPDGPRYLNYSTVVDCPVSYGLIREEFIKHRRGGLTMTFRRYVP